MDLRKLAGCRFAAIGPATRRRSGGTGHPAGISAPPPPPARNLGRLLIASVPAGQPILLLRAENSTPLLPAMLREAGYPVEEHSLYRTVYQPLRPALAGETLVFRQRRRGACLCGGLRRARGRGTMRLHRPRHRR